MQAARAARVWCPQCTYADGGERRCRGYTGCGAPQLPILCAAMARGTPSRPIQPKHCLLTLNQWLLVVSHRLLAVIKEQRTMIRNSCVCQA